MLGPLWINRTTGLNFRQFPTEDGVGQFGELAANLSKSFYESIMDKWLISRQGGFCSIGAHSLQGEMQC